MHDIVIIDGLVIDGTGASGTYANIAIDGDTITAVTTDDVTGRRTICADGLVVAPGFIDLHTHADFTIESSPAAVTQLAQGVTTLVGGNCGHSPFPLTDRNRDIDTLAGVDPATLSWDWTDAAGFAAAVTAVRPGVNLALQIGHNAVRSAVLAHENRAPSPEELAEMRNLVATAAAQGVIGFSTGLIYPPGRFSRTDEVVDLVRTAAGFDLLYSTHIRNETDEVIAAVVEALDTATAAGARLQVSHLKSMGPGNHGLAQKALELIVEACDAGLDVACDVYPYTASSTSLASRLPSWALDGGTAAVAARLADPVQRARIIEGLTERFGRDIDPAGVVLADVGPGPFSASVGRSLTEISVATGMDPAQVVVAVLAAHGDVAIVNHSMVEDDVRAVLRSPLTAIASDGWTLTATGTGCPHPRSFGTFARVLGRYVPELLTLEQAVHKATGLPASRAHLTRRGLLAAGAAADVTVFDADTIIDNSTYDAPWQLATGVRAVLVGGVIAVDAGEITDERGGRVITR